jgi:hypothetical protein
MSETTELLPGPPIKLSSQEDNFCLGVIEYGGNIGAAYRAAFGIGITNPAARGKSLINRPDIALRIKQLAEAAQDHALISLGSHFMQLARIRDLAVNIGDMRTGLAAEVKRGELARFYQEQAPKDPTDGAKFVQINFVGGMQGAASPLDWAQKFGAGKQPVVIENGQDK